LILLQRQKLKHLQLKLRGDLFMLLEARMAMCSEGEMTQRWLTWSTAKL
jgi:hypothetical protein